MGFRRQHLGPRAFPLRFSSCQLAASRGGTRASRMARSSRRRPGLDSLATVKWVDDQRAACRGRFICARRRGRCPRLRSIGALSVLPRRRRVPARPLSSHPRRDIAHLRGHATPRDLPHAPTTSRGRGAGGRGQHRVSRPESRPRRRLDGRRAPRRLGHASATCSPTAIAARASRRATSCAASRSSTPRVARCCRTTKPASRRSASTSLATRCTACSRAGRSSRSSSRARSTRLNVTPFDQVRMAKYLLRQPDHQGNVVGSRSGEARRREGDDRPNAARQRARSARDDHDAVQRQHAAGALARLARRAVRDRSRVGS